MWYHTRMDNNEVTIKVVVPHEILTADENTKDEIFEHVMERASGESFETLGKKGLAKIGARTIGILAGLSLLDTIEKDEESEEKEAYKKMSALLSCVIQQSIEKDLSIELKIQ